MKVIDLKKLNAIINEQGRRRDWLAKKLDVSGAQVTYMLGGMRPFKQVHIAMLSTALGVPQKRFVKNSF